jgi:lysozyme
MSTDTINRAGIALLHESESFVGHAYPDPYSPLGKALRASRLWRRYLREPFALSETFAGLSGKPWTIGWGFTLGVAEGQRMTMAHADARLAVEMQEYISGVVAALTDLPNENELAAMVVLAWNIGVTRFRKSTVVRAHNRGDKPAAARAFRLWNRAQGEVSPGLETRRAAEAALYLKPVAGVAPAPVLGGGMEPEEVLAQAVDSERPMTASTINRAGVVAGGTATVATVSEVVNTVQDLKTGVEGLQDWLVPMLLIVTTAAVGYIVWERVKQRAGGWA